MAGGSVYGRWVKIWNVGRCMTGGQDMEDGSAYGGWVVWVCV